MTKTGNSFMPKDLHLVFLIGLRLTKMIAKFCYPINLLTSSLDQQNIPHFERELKMVLKGKLVAPSPAERWSQGSRSVRTCFAQHLWYLVQGH